MVLDSIASWVINIFTCWNETNESVLVPSIFIHLSVDWCKDLTSKTSAEKSNTQTLSFVDYTISRCLKQLKTEIVNDDGE